MVCPMGAIGSVILSLKTYLGLSISDEIGLDVDDQ